MRKVTVKLSLKISFSLTQRCLLECLNDQIFMLALKKHFFHPRASESNRLIFCLPFYTVQLVDEFRRAKNCQSKFFIEFIAVGTKCAIASYKHLNVGCYRMSNLSQIGFCAR